jgi:hypothetical protein
MGEDEEAMLSEAFYVKANSRLGCQIPITENLEGLELELALKVNKKELVLAFFLSCYIYFYNLTNI